jgi:uncharacterized membrane protein
MSDRRRTSPVLIRSLVAAVAGAAAAALMIAMVGAIAGVLSGWAVFALVEVVWVLVIVWRMDAVQTRAHARAEDPGRPIARSVALVGSLASLAAVALVLIQTGDEPRAEALTAAAIAVVSVAASWGLIQVDYMLRIAAQYYADPVGGIDFNQDEDPMYTDFAYVSFGLGMTYQIADTNIQTNAIRRLVIAQTLLAYLFGAVILATVINLVTGL